MTRKIKRRKRMTGDLKELSVQQQLFCEYIQEDPKMSPAKAAEKAGYKHPAQSAARIMKNPIVIAHLGKVLNERIERARYNADDVLDHLFTALFLDPLELFEQDIEPGVYIARNLEEIPPHIRRCITEIETTTNTDRHGARETRIKFKTISKESSMVNALKHLGLLPASQSQVNIDARKQELHIDNPYRNLPPEKVIEALEVLDELEEEGEGLE